MKTIKRHIGIYKGCSIPWLMVGVTLILMLVRERLWMLSIYLTADILNASQLTVDIPQMIKYVAVTIGTAVAEIVIYYVGEWTYQKINLGVRTKLWNKLMRLPTQYYDSESSDTLVSRVTTDASESHQYFDLILTTVSTIYAGIIAIQAMFAYNVRMSQYMMILIPFLIGAGWVHGKLKHTAGRKAQETFAGSTGYLVEKTRNLRLIKASRTEYEEEQLGKALFTRQFFAGIWSTAANNSYLLIMEVSGIASLIISFYFGGQAIQAGELAMGDLFGFYLVGSRMISSIVRIIQILGYIKDTQGRLDKIASLLDLPDEKKDGIQFDVADADIIVKDVSFSYGNQPALERISFRIPKGEVTAIVGGNGAGKSTMFKLLERMYDPQAGALYFGEDDVRTFNMDSWRQSFAIVSQDAALLSGTIRDNILYGVQRKVSDEELIRVAKLANVYDFAIATPGGLDAPVGMGGGNFSGGQRQCIAIARAMMRNPDYLLLDEATASLDAKSEQIVSQALTNLMKGRTTVMIAHNYSATRDASHVVVMRDGHVEAEGSPKELLATNEYYRVFAGRASA